MQKLNSLRVDHNTMHRKHIILRSLVRQFSFSFFPDFNVYLFYCSLRNITAWPSLTLSPSVSLALQLGVHIPRTNCLDLTEVNLMCVAARSRLYRPDCVNSERCKRIVLEEYPQTKTEIKYLKCVVTVVRTAVIHFVWLVYHSVC